MSATPPRLTSPISPRHSTTPLTPASSQRQTRASHNSLFSSTSEESSPTSTLSDQPAAIGPLRLGGDSRAALRNLTASSSRMLSVRSDPSMLTCFDPADKELYDLWAPKR